MPITIPSRASAVSTIRSYFRNRFPSRNNGSESFLGKTARAVAMAVWQISKAIQDADQDSVPQDDTSTDGLDRWAEALGLDNGNGSYGRHIAVPATGGACETTNQVAYGGAGPFPFVVPAATALLGPDGVTEFELASAISYPAAGSQDAFIQAVTGGVVGNLEAGEVLTFVSPPAGLDATATLSTGLTGGLDEESDAALLERIQFRMRNPPKGGTAADYRYWCENASNVTTGVAIAIERGYVYPRRSGTGTVDMVITRAASAATSVVTQGNGDDERVPSAATQTAVQAYIDYVRPVTVEEATVLLPDRSAGTELDVIVAMEPSLARFDFDWDDTVNPRPTVVSYPTTTSIEINGACNVELLAQINAYVAQTRADPPRIQIGGTHATAPVKAQVVGCLSINTVPANDVITVDATITGTAVATNVIYAAGPMVEDTQQAIVDYINTLGPSRDSGLANVDDSWQDTAYIARLKQTALNVESSDGTPYSKDCPTALLNGVAADVTPVDVAASSPRLLYARRVVVRKA